MIIGSTKLSKSWQNKCKKTIVKKNSKENKSKKNSLPTLPLYAYPVKHVSKDDLDLV